MHDDDNQNFVSARKPSAHLGQMINLELNVKHSVFLMTLCSLFTLTLDLCPFSLSDHGIDLSSLTTSPE